MPKQSQPKGYSSALDKNRYRRFCIELYPDTDSYDYDEVLLYLVQNSVTWSYIVHDKDEDNEGKLKKPHVHMVIVRKNGSTCSALSKCTKIPVNFIEPCRKYIPAIRYLVHRDDPDKFQYNQLEVNTNDPKFLEYFGIYKPSEADQCMDMIHAIADNHFNLRELCQFAYDHDSWAALRRNFYILKCFLSANEK